jgi:secreted trypsin-like serine protease
VSFIVVCCFVYFLVIISIDACAGDSGGPLMMFSSNMQWELIGLVSTGTGCADPLFSGIYTRVAAFESWIRLNTFSPNWISGDVPVTSTVMASTGVSVSNTTTGVTSGFSLINPSAASALNCYHLFFLYFIYLSIHILF